MTTNNSAFIQEVLRLTNQFRAQHNLNPLTLNSELNSAAQRHTQDMADGDFLSHTGSDGSDVAMRIQDAGYFPNTSAENVASGYTTPKAVVEGWINSPGHRANMLNPNFTEIGIGYINQENAQDQDGFADYWTQVFGSGDTNPGTTPTNPTDPTNPTNPTNPVNGPDILIGTDEVDTLVGTAANNYIVGKGGGDSLTGGAGADMFIFTSSTQGLDTITDFNASEGDKIVFIGNEFFDGSLGATKSSINWSTEIVSYGNAQIAQLVGADSFSSVRGATFAAAGLPNIVV